MSKFSINQTRRKLLSLAGSIGLLGTAASSARGDEDDTPSRDGQEREGSQFTAQGFGDDLAEKITTNEFAATIVDTEYRGVAEQAASFTQQLQEFPRLDETFAILSTGIASEAPNDPEFFASTSFSNDRSIEGYSPDGFDANSLVDLELTFEVPEDAEGIGFDYQFGTEESPSFLGSEFQDFFEAQLITPDGDVENIALINGEAVTVDVADTVANTPDGTSQNPLPPFPDPSDVAYNAVTEVQEIERSIAQYQNEEVTLRFRAGDASDGIYDSAVFIDNLRFLGDVDIDPGIERAEQAFEEAEEAYNDLLESHWKADAHSFAIKYDAFGDDFLQPLVDYFGIRAGSLDDATLDDEVEEVLNMVIEGHDDRNDIQFTEERSETMYNFFADLQEALSESMSLSTIKTTTYNYFIGEGQDQTAFLDVGEGETFSDVLAEDFGISDTLLTRLQEENPTADQVDEVVELFEQQASNYRNRATEILEEEEAEAQRVVQVANSGAESLFEIQVQEYEDGSVDTEDVGTAAVVSTSAAVYVVLTAGASVIGFAAGALKGGGIKKCVGSAVAGQVEGVQANAIEVSGPLATTAEGISTLSNTVSRVGSFLPAAQTSADTQAVDPVSGFVKGYKAGAIAGGLDLTTTALETGLQLFQAGDIDGEAELELEDATREEAGFLESLWNSFASTIKSLFGSSSNETADMMIADGQLTITNTGTEPWGPSLGTEETVFAKDQSASLSYSMEIENPDAVEELTPGSSHTYDVRVEVPADAGFTSGRADVEVGASVPGEILSKESYIPIGLCEIDYVPTVDVDSDTFVIQEDVETETVEAGSAAEGETVETEYLIAQDGIFSYIELVYSNLSHYANLQVRDQEGNLTGFDPTKPEGDPQEAEEILLSEYSGVDTGEQGREWVRVAEPADEDFELDISVVVPEVGTLSGSDATTENVETQQLSVDFEVNSTVVPELDPEMSTSDEVIVSDVDPGDNITAIVTISETNGDNALGTVTCSVTEFENEEGETFEATLEETEFNIGASETETVGVTGTVPEDPTNGTFTSEMIITSEEGGDDSTTLIIVVDDAVPAGFPGSADQFNAIAGDDGEINQPDLSGAINEWFQSEDDTIDGVEFGQDELSAIINWWFQEQS